MISRQWKAKPYLNYVMKPDEKHAFRKDENQNTTLVFFITRPSQNVNAFRPGEEKKDGAFDIVSRVRGNRPDQVRSYHRDF